VIKQLFFSFFARIMDVKCVFMQGHAGCVNCLTWNEKGRLVIIFCFVIRLSVLLCLLAVITVCCVAKSYHIIRRFIVHRLQ